MKSVARMFATLAVAFLLACPLLADDTSKPGSTTKPATTTNKDGAANSTAVPAPDAAAKAAPEVTAPTPVPQSGGAGAMSIWNDTPKFELFLGYSNVLATPMSLGNRIADVQGGDTNLAFNFSRHFGIVGDFAGYTANTLTFNAPGIPSRDVGADGKVFTYMIGPRFSYRRPRFTLFAQALIGDASAGKVTVNGCIGSSVCTALPSENVFAAALGGGLDVNVHRHIAIRVIQAEYLMTRFMDPSATSELNRVRNNMRLSAGIVFRSGGNPPLPPPTASCSIQPAEIFAGETVTATASGTNFDPKGTITYSWNGTGVKVMGSEASSQIDTTGLQPGAYVVTANLNGGRHGTASCSARFTVKVPQPPVISCSAAPSSVQTGGTSTITSSANSPDGRRLIYSYTTSAGEISGNNATATLNTRDAQPGTITIACNVSDDRIPALTASATTTVAVEAPPPPPAPAPAPEIAQLEIRLALHSIYFPTARPTSANPGGGLVESQEKILLALAQDFNKYLTYKQDAHLTLFGHADKRGSEEYNKALTDRRVERTKSFLVEHGVPATAIETKSLGKDDNLTADQVKELMTHDPDLSPDQRKQLLSNLQVMVWANNRRVDVSLSTTGQQSVRLYPFNANDFLALINTKGADKTAAAKKKAKKQ